MLNWNRNGLEGFMEAERVHGVRYIYIGDSSVDTTLLQNVPGWGHAIEKQTMPANAIVRHWSSWFRTIVLTREVRGSL